MTKPLHMIFEWRETVGPSRALCCYWRGCDSPNQLSLKIKPTTIPNKE